MGEENKDLEVEKKVEEKKESSDTKKETDVDVNKMKADGVSEYLKSLGVDDETLKAIIEDKKKRDDENKTDLQKAQDNLSETTKQLASEKKARLVAEAKVSAMTMGVNPKIIDDFIVIAMAKAEAGKKDISDIISEMKDSETSSFYFVSEEKKEEKKNRNVTRKRKTEQDSNEVEKDKEGIEGTTAYRITRSIVESRKKKSSFFS